MTTDAAVRPEDVAMAAAWAEETMSRNGGTWRVEHKLAQLFANHRAASTQALREAAERLCVEVERLRLGGWVANAKSAAIALRTALAALETKP
jgi:hypothetical protein